MVSDKEIELAQKIEAHIVKLRDANSKESIILVYDEILVLLKEILEDA